MNTIIQKIVFLFSLLVSFLANGQQTSLNTLYNQNGYLINPAAAGLNNCFSAYLNHRNQWVGINESPVNNTLTVDGRLMGPHGVGVDMRMQEIGLLQNFNFKLTYAYHLKLTENSNLSFGLSAGMVQQSFGFSDVIVANTADNTLLGGNQSDIGFLSDAGLLFSTARLKVGLSVPQLITSGLVTEVDAVNAYNLVQHMVVFGAYDIMKNELWTVTPSVLYKNADFIGHQIDLGLRGTWKNTIGVGAMYRTAYGVIGLVDLNLKDQFKLAYGYGFSGSNLTGLSNGSHEIMLGIKLCRKPDGVPALDKPEEPEKPQEKIQEEPENPEEEESEEDVQEEPVNKSEEVIVEVEKDTIVEPVTEPVVEEVAEAVVEEIVVPVEAEELNIDSLNMAFAAEGRLIMYNLNSADDVHSNNRELVVEMVAQILKENPDLNVVVIGYTCDIGTSEYNQGVSRQRAENIKTELINSGVEAKKIKTQAKGENQPFAPNNTETNQRKNRRVQIVFKSN